MQTVIGSESVPLFIYPVWPSDNIQRDLEWYENFAGFKYSFGDHGYAGQTFFQTKIKTQ